MTRHTIVIKLDRASGTIRLNFGNEDAGHVRIRMFQFRGLTSSSWFFVSFNKIATLPVSAGTSNPLTYISSSEFPLPIDAVAPNTVCNYQFQKPINIMGADNLMTANQEIDFAIKDSTGNLAQFTDGILVLDFIPRSQYNPIKGDRRISNTIKTDQTERHEAFTLFNYSDGHRPHFTY